MKYVGVYSCPGLQLITTRNACRSPLETSHHNIRLTIFTDGSCLQWQIIISCTSVDEYARYGRQKCSNVFTLSAVSPVA